jgi:hypothetical protein
MKINIQIANEIICNLLNLKTKYSFHDFKKHFKDENEDQPPWEIIPLNSCAETHLLE